MNRKQNKFIGTFLVWALALSVTTFSVAGLNVVSAAERQPVQPIYVNFGAEESPYVYGTPTEVDLSKVEVQGGVVTGIAVEEINRLFAEAAKHNTPIILDLSNEAITEIAENAFAYAPIHVLKLPAGITKIGANAFRFGLIHQIYFKADPSLIEIGEDAFKQAEPMLRDNGNGQRQRINAQAAPGDGNNILPIGQDFVLYGMMRDPNSPETGFIKKQENPYFIDVNGVRTYATLSSDEPEVFEVGEDGLPIQNSPTINLYPTAFTPFSSANLRVAQEKPIDYTLHFHSKNGAITTLSGSNFVPLNRATYLDVTPNFENNEYKLSYRPIGESTGVDSNIATARLNGEGYHVVGLNEMYPNLDEAQIRAIVKDLQEKYMLYDNSYQGATSLLIRNISKKYHDIVFVAKPATITYAYYDVATGNQLAVEEIKTYEGIPLPDFNAPDGYTPVMKNFDILPRVRTSEIIVIPVKKNDDGQVTSSISFVNESGFKIGPTFYLSGTENEPIDLDSAAAAEIKEFMTKYKVKPLEAFEGRFARNKAYIISVKGKLSDLVGPAGPSGANGSVGERGPRGEKGERGERGPAGRDGVSHTTIINNEMTSAEIVKKIIEDKLSFQDLSGKINKDVLLKLEDLRKEFLLQQKDKAKTNVPNVTVPAMTEIKQEIGCCHYYNILGIRFRWCCRWNFYWLLLLTIVYIAGMLWRRRRYKEIRERLEELEKRNFVNHPKK